MPYLYIYSRHMVLTTDRRRAYELPPLPDHMREPPYDPTGHEFENEPHCAGSTPEPFDCTRCSEEVPLGGAFGFYKPLGRTCIPCVYDLLDELGDDR